MEVKIKITKHGGYVLGDGECPFNPDEFLMAFGDKIIEAQRQGLTEIGIDTETANALIEKAKEHNRQEILDAPEFGLNVNGRPKKIMRQIINAMED